MTLFAIATLAAAFSAAPEARAGDARPPLAPPPALGGPYEPVEATIVVEAERSPLAEPWTIAPDHRLQHRHAPRGRRLLNRITVKF